MRDPKSHPTDAEDGVCRQAGKLIRRLGPDTGPVTDIPGPLRYELSRQRPGRLKAGVSVLVLGSGTALLVVAMLHRGGPTRPDEVALGYEVAGVVPAPDGHIEAKSGHSARIRFTDGTVVELPEGSSGAVTERTSVGATFELDEGHAKFDVVHRAHAHWRVTAGPFETLVTGTNFDLSWSPATESFSLDLHAGTVVVRGGSAGTGISLHAGERLLLKADAPLAPSHRLEEHASDHGRSLSAGSAQGTARPRLRAHVAETSKVADLSRTAENPPWDAPGTPPAPIEPGRFGPTSPHSSPISSEPPALAAGGARCSAPPPQLRFDSSTEGARASTMSALAFSHLMLSTDRSWCGGGSLSADTDFNLLGPPNRLHRRPHEAGGVWVNLGHAVNFTAKTLTAHIYVEAPQGVRYSAELYVINGADLGEEWVGGGEITDFLAGRWVTITHTFAKENRLWDGKVTDVENSHFIAINVYSQDGSKVWHGKVFIDDIGWQ
jgi:hypothetical protein